MEENNDGEESEYNPFALTKDMTHVDWWGAPIYEEDEAEED